MPTLTPLMCMSVVCPAFVSHWEPVSLFFSGLGNQQRPICVPLLSTREHTFLCPVRHPVCMYFGEALMKACTSDTFAGFLHVLIADTNCKWEGVTPPENHTGTKYTLPEFIHNVQLYLLQPGMLQGELW